MMNWKDLPPDFQTILRRHRDLKLTKMINISFVQDGDRVLTQVSVMRGNDTSKWGVASHEDPLVAFLQAAGPGAGGSWAEHLKLNVKPPTADAEDDDMDVV